MVQSYGTLNSSPTPTLQVRNPESPDVVSSPEPHGRPWKESFPISVLARSRRGAGGEQKRLVGTCHVFLHCWLFGLEGKLSLRNKRAGQALGSQHGARCFPSIGHVPHERMAPPFLTGGGVVLAGDPHEVTGAGPQTRSRVKCLPSKSHFENISMKWVFASVPLF